MHSLRPASSHFSPCLIGVPSSASHALVVISTTPLCSPPCCTSQVSSALKAVAHATESATSHAPFPTSPPARSPAVGPAPSPPPSLAPSPRPTPYIRSQSLVHHRNAAGTAHNPCGAAGTPLQGSNAEGSGGWKASSVASAAFGALTSEVREGGASWPSQGRPRAHPAPYPSLHTRGTPEAHQPVMGSQSQPAPSSGLSFAGGPALCMSHSVDSSSALHGRGGVLGPEGGHGRGRHELQSVEPSAEESEEMSEEVREAMRRDMARLEQQVKQQEEAWERRRLLREQQRRQEEEKRQKEERLAEERRERQRQAEIVRMLEEGRRRAAEEKRDIEARIALGAAAALARARAGLAQAHATPVPVPHSSSPASLQGSLAEERASRGAGGTSPLAPVMPQGQPQVALQFPPGLQQATYGNLPEMQQGSPGARPGWTEQGSREPGTGHLQGEQGLRDARQWGESRREEGARDTLQVGVAGEQHGQRDALQWGGAWGEQRKNDALRERSNGIPEAAPEAAFGIPGASHGKDSSKQAALGGEQGLIEQGGSVQGQSPDKGTHVPVAQQPLGRLSSSTESWDPWARQQGDNTRDGAGTREAWAGAETEPASGRASALASMMGDVRLSGRDYDSHVRGTSMRALGAQGASSAAPNNGGSSFSAELFPSAQQQVPVPAAPSMAQVSTDSFLFCSMGGGILDMSTCVAYHSSSN